VTLRCLALVSLVVLSACEDKRKRAAQETFDRSVEESAGLYRDTDGRSYKLIRDKAIYQDARGGEVPPDKLPAGAPRPPPPPPPENDVTRGEEAAALGDTAKAASLYKRACEAKVPGGCGHLALLHRDGDGVPKDPALAESMAATACNGGDAFGCYALGIVLETVQDQSGAWRPAKDVIAAYEKGCAGSSVEACHELGMLYHSGRGGAGKDPVKASTALKKACELGDRISCHQATMVTR